MSLLFSATYPERTAALVLWASFARVSWAPDYPDGFDAQASEATYQFIAEHWGEGGVLRRLVLQDAPEDPVVQQIMARYERNSATPASAVETLRFGVETDVRPVLPAISAPTLVVHHSGDPLIPVHNGRYLASHISGAGLAEFPGDIHLSAVGSDAPLIDAVEEFLTGERRAQPPERVLKTVLFTDIVDSTQRAAEIGDRRWCVLLDAHDVVVRREIERALGREVKTTGDGFFAAFDGPARAIRCAQAIGCKRAAWAWKCGPDCTPAVRDSRRRPRRNRRALGARVAALAAPGEILATGTVRDLVAGSGIEFVERGARELKGVPGEWRILAVRS